VVLHSIEFVGSDQLASLGLQSCEHCMATANPLGGCPVRLGMENRFFVEAKSFTLSVVKGFVELRLVEKRNGFSGWVLLGERCVAWLLLMVQEVLRDRGSELFVKSFREGSKVTIVRLGGNSSGRFLEVAVYDVGGRRGMVVFPEGRDRRGWGRVFGELSKVLVFFLFHDGVVIL
jgi:hypothetical protein